MRKPCHHIFLAISAILLLSFGSLGKLSAQTTDLPIKVGIKIAPPFAMKDDDGQWTGLSVELWNEIAAQLNIKFSWQESNLTDLLAGVSKGELDAGIAAITVTADRETQLDFSHTYYLTGLSIATPIQANTGWITIIRGIFSIRMLQVVLALLVLLFLVGTAAWWVERRNNPKHFSNDAVKGIAGGVWWAAVTMTTVGYGDMAPKSLMGRVIALFWMFASLILLSSLIAVISSTLTLGRIEPLVTSPEDLAKARVASIENSTSDAYLKAHKITPEYFPSVPAALDALDQGDMDAVVYDKALLQYLVNQQYKNSLEIYEGVFESQYYGIAFPENSPLKERVNRVLLKIISGEQWNTKLSKYLGVQ